MYVALKIVDEQMEDGLFEAVSEQRFQGLDDFDRNVMTRIFNFSICNNDGVLVLLDNAMILKKKSIRPIVDQELRAEFVFLFINAMESLVRRGHTLADLGTRHT